MPAPSDSSSPGADPRELEALQALLTALQRLPSEARTRVLHTVATFFGVSPNVSPQWAAAPPTDVDSDTLQSRAFSSDRSPSPKDFLFSKKPQTDVERVACLAYYLTHYRDTPHFKTLALSKLNTEAAQLKLSNAAYATANATRTGFLVPASKGMKQLSVVGEIYVEALPDRAAAKAAVSESKLKRRNRRTRLRGKTSEDQK